MKKLALMMLILASAAFAVAQAVEPAAAREIADSNARSLWGAEISPDAAIPYYDQDGQLLAWCFNYSLSGPFPDPRELRNQLAEAELRGDRRAASGADDFAYIVIGARQDVPVFFEYAQRLAVDHIKAAELEAAAAREFPGGWQQGKTYYFDLANTWFSFSDGSRTAYINPLPGNKVLSESEFQALGQKLGKFWEKRDHSAAWLNVPMSIGAQRTDVVLSSVDYVPFYHWHWGCTPTAISMLFSWWDQFAGFGRLDNYHMTAYDMAQEDFEHHVTDTCRELHTAMLTSDDGGTSSPNQIPGLTTVIASRGYTTSSLYLDFDNAWGLTRQSVDAGFPIITHTISHSTTGVGYRFDPDMYCTVDPNHPVLTWVNLDELVFVTVIMFNQLPNYPQVSLTSPDGGHDYWNNSGGETLLSNDYNEISWNTQNTFGSYVKLYYHLQGGINPDLWIPIIDNTANDGSYVWQVPPISVGGNNFTDFGRIKVEMCAYGSDQLLASDGSYGNFTINPGGNAYLGFTSQSITDSKDFCVASYNQPDTWNLVLVKDLVNNGSGSWNLSLYPDTGFDETPTLSEGTDDINYIAVNHHQLAPHQYGVLLENRDDDSDAQAHIAGSISNILNPGTHNLNWETNVKANIWNVQLEAGTHFFELSTADAQADFEIALYPPGGDGVFGYGEALAASRNRDPGGLESFILDVATPGVYGLVVSARTLTTAAFQLRIMDGSIWEGDISTDWNVPGNWSGNAVPGAGDNVFIPDRDNDPMIGNSLVANAKTLTVASGAVLRLYTCTLIVNANLQVSGRVELLQSGSLLRVLGNVAWENGSSLYSPGSSTLECHGNWSFLSGSTFMPSGGTVRLLYNRDTYIQNHSLSTRFHKLVINKQDGKTVSFLGSSTQDLKIVNSLTFQAGYLGSSSGRTIILEGQLVSTGGGCKLDSGTFRLTGAGTTLSASTGSWFQNLELMATNATLGSNLLCKGDLIQSTGTLALNGYELAAWGDISLNGIITSNSAASKLSSGDDFIWNSNSGCAATAGSFECGGNWIVENNAYLHFGAATHTWMNAYFGAAIRLKTDVQFGNLYINGTEEEPRFWLDSNEIGTLTVAGNLTVNATNTLDIMDKQVLLQGTLHLYGILAVSSGQFTTNNAPNLYAGSVLDLGSGTFWNAKSSHTQTTLNGTLIMADPNAVFGGQFQALTLAAGSVNNITTGTIKCTNITATTAGTFQPGGGLVEFGTWAGTGLPNLNVSSGNWLHHAKVNTSTSINLWTDLVIKGDLELASGTLDVSASNCTIRIAGSWIHLQSTAGFTPRGGRVIFNGEEDQYLSGTETFHILENANTGGDIRIDNPAHSVTCAAYDNVGSTGLHVAAGTFTANDLLDAGIFGFWGAQSAGVINLNNPDGPVDLRGGINLNGGTMNIYGGTGDSWWSEDSNASVTIYAGLLNFANRGIVIGDSSILTENITGGTIRTVGNFTCLNTAFTPSGGTLELVGGVNTTLALNAGYLWSLKVNKTSTASVTATTALVLKDDFILAGGSFVAGTAVAVGGDWTNNMGPNFFTEGSSTVDFNGAGTQNIATNEIFNALRIYNTSGSVRSSAITLGLKNNLVVAGNLILAPGSTILMDINKAVNVSTNGRLEALGTLEQPILFSRLGATGEWWLDVYDGGIIAAEYCTFEYLYPNAVRILATGLADLDHAFNYCTFRHAHYGGVHLRLENSQDLAIYGASFPVDNGGYNVIKLVDAGSATFINASGVMAGEDRDYDNFNRINWTSGVPQITSLDISFVGANTVLTWTSAPAHNNFKIYAADSPDGTFTEAGTSTTYTWSEPTQAARRFFRVTALQ